jgi:hypothetical protein
VKIPLDLNEKFGWEDHFKQIIMSEILHKYKNISKMGLITYTTHGYLIVKSAALPRHYTQCHRIKPIIFPLIKEISEV